MHGVTGAAAGRAPAEGVVGVFDAQVKLLDPVTVAFVVMQGPYSQVPEAMGRVYGYAAQHGLRPEGMPSAVYFTDPAETPEEDAIWEVRAPLAGDPPEATPDESGCGVRRLPAERVVSAVHRGPYEEIGPTYDALAEWAEGNGLAITGPPEEVYFSDPSTPPEECVTEVRFPVG